MLRIQFIVCAILVLLSIPVYFLDNYWLKGGGGDWLSLDFSKLLFRAYLLFIGIYIAVSTVSLLINHGNSFLKVHLFSLIISVLILSVGFFISDNYSDYSFSKQRIASIERRDSFFNDICLIRWWFLPDMKSPKEIHVDLTIAAVGRFSGHAIGKENDENSNNIFTSDGEEQRQVKTGDTIHYVFPLTFINAGNAHNIEFTFSLFKHPPGVSGDDDITKVFQNPIVKNADASFLYETLVPPLDKAPE